MHISLIYEHLYCTNILFVSQATKGRNVKISQTLNKIEVYYFLCTLLLYMSFNSIDILYVAAKGRNVKNMDLIFKTTDFYVHIPLIYKDFLCQAPKGRNVKVCKCDFLRPLIKIGDQIFWCTFLLIYKKKFCYVVFYLLQLLILLYFNEKNFI